MALLFEGDSLQAWYQRGMIEYNKYDLCIDQVDEAIQITGQTGWGHIKAGTKVVLSFVNCRYFNTAGIQECELCKALYRREAVQSHPVQWFVLIYTAPTYTTVS